MFIGKKRVLRCDYSPNVISIFENCDEVMIMRNLVTKIFLFWKSLKVLTFEDKPFLDFIFEFHNPV